MFWGKLVNDISYYCVRTVETIIKTYKFDLCVNSRVDLTGLRFNFTGQTLANPKQKWSLRIGLRTAWARLGRSSTPNTSNKLFIKKSARESIRRCLINKTITGISRDYYYYVAPNGQYTHARCPMSKPTTIIFGSDIWIVIDNYVVSQGRIQKFISKRVIGLLHISDTKLDLKKLVKPPQFAC